MFTDRLRLQSWFIALIAVASIFAGQAAPSGASVCTLADHIRSANTNTAVGFCPAGTSHDIITIAEDITLTEPLPPITGTITIEGGGHTISGDEKFPIFVVRGGRLTVNNLTLTEGYFEGSWEKGWAAAGGIQVRNGGKLFVNDSVFTNNRSGRGHGGAIAVDRSTLSVNNSSFVKNRSSGQGGAIYVWDSKASITNSAFVDNSTRGMFARGGGVYTGFRSRLDIANSTFHRNFATDGGAVGTDYTSHGPASTRLTHVTMIDNRATNGDSIFIDPRDSTFSLRNSILSSFVTGGGSRNCHGRLNQNVGNLIADGSCASAIDGDPMIAELTGSPAYFPLLDGSPALDAADPRFCPDTDQLGRARPQGGGCDIGAIESTTAVAEEKIEPEVCPLPDQIVAANRDQAVGNCAAGNGADTIHLLRDFTLDGALPRITTDITIEGNGHTISGRHYRHLIFLVDGGRLSINNLTLKEGKGAIKAVNGGDVYVNDSHFIDNFSSGGGGAILIRSSGSELVVNNSSFVGNRTENSSTDGSGGAILSFGPSTNISNSSFANNQAQFEGGAIDTSNTGQVKIANSSFVDNRARSGGAINTANGGRVDITNSTFSGNSAKYGGALSNSGAVTTITHVTMLDNKAQIGTAIWTRADNHFVRLRNSIVAGARRHYTACFGHLTQNIGNLIEDGSCSPALSGDPLLAELTGSLAYLPLQVDSPARDAAIDALCPATDQIGTSRPQGGGCDIGAIEFKVAGPPRLESSAAEQELSDCAVTTTHDLNLRDGPNGVRIGGVPRQTTLEAMARESGWFNVEFQGKSGWISADYVVAEGDCR